MTQATDLGNIGNQLAAVYRTRVNANIQALATQHYGAAEPSPLYPNMIWFSSGDGYIKVRNPTNTAWQVVGTIGPPMKWTNVDTPAMAWKTGDVKPSFAGGETGWIVLNDGTIGNGSSGATTRANPDCAALFALFWLAGGLPMYVAGTWTEVGRGASAAADFAANRHLQTPKVLSRALAGAGQGAGMTVMRYWCWWDGDEFVPLAEAHLPTIIPSRRTIMRLPERCRTTQPTRVHRPVPIRSLMFRPGLIGQKTIPAAPRATSAVATVTRTSGRASTATFSASSKRPP